MYELGIYRKVIMHYPTVSSTGLLLVNHRKKKKAMRNQSRSCSFQEVGYRDQLVLEFKGLSSGHIDGTTTVRAALLLILFLGESFSASDR